MSLKLKLSFQKKDAHSILSGLISSPQFAPTPQDFIRDEVKMTIEKTKSNPVEWTLPPWVVSGQQPQLCCEFYILGAKVTVSTAFNVLYFMKIIHFLSIHGSCKIPV